MGSLLYVLPCPDRPIARDMAGGQGFGSGDEMLLPPLEGLYHVTVARDAGWDVAIRDLNHPEHREGFAPGPTDALIVEVQLPTFEHDLEAARQLREQTGATLWLRTFIDETPLLERALRETGARALLRSQNYPLLPEVLAGTTRAGTSWLEDDALCSEPAPALHEPDGLPIPDRGLLGDATFFYPLLPGGPCTTIKTSWGCPFSCGYYCPYPLGEGKAGILRGADHVVAELADIAERGITRVLMRDATFTLSMKRTRAICEGILARGLELTWWCETRIDLLDRGLLELMKRAGCAGINVGIETGDPELMANSLKTGLDAQSVEAFVEDARDVGLDFHLLCVLGLPGETRTTIRNTFRFLDRLRPKSLNFTFATPYPGTEYHGDAHEYGWIVEEGFGDFAANRLVARSIFLDAGELTWAMEHIWRFVGAYRDGDDTAARGVLDEVEAWAADTHWPYLTVVVPTFNRCKKLERCLDHLVKQSLPAHCFEVVVVDDGSDDGTADFLEEFGQNAPFELRVHYQDNAGPGKARNLAIREARGEVLLFIGDDIYLRPDAIQHHAAWHRAHGDPADAVVGNIDWAPSVQRNEFMRWLDTTNLQFGFATAEHGEQQGYGFFYTSNLSVKRDFLLEHGVFDEAFRHAIWEDIELGYRLELDGLRIWYDSHARALHDDVVTFERFVERQRLVGRYTMLVLAKHHEYAAHNPRLFSTILCHLAMRLRHDEPEADAERWERAIGHSYLEGLQEGFAEWREALPGKPASFEDFVSGLHETQLEVARGQIAGLEREIEALRAHGAELESIDTAQRGRIERLLAALAAREQKPTGQDAVRP